MGISSPVEVYAFGWKIVDPVVVSPETDSNKASIEYSRVPLKIKGREPKTLLKIQISMTDKIPSLKRRIFSLGAESTRNSAFPKQMQRTIVSVNPKVGYPFFSSSTY